MALRLQVILLLLAAPCLADRHEPAVAASGRITAVVLDGSVFPFETNLWAPTRGWSPIATLQDATGLQPDRADAARRAAGSLNAGGGACRFEIVTDQAADGSTRQTVRVTAQRDADIEGLFYWVELPVDLLAGGQATLHAAGGDKAVELPMQFPGFEQRHLLHADAAGVTLADAAGRAGVELTFDRPLAVTVQDGRQWTPHYQLMICFHHGPLKQDESASAAVTLRARLAGDSAPACVSLAAAPDGEPFDGLGGNFVYGFDDAAAQYNIENLRCTWARVEMLLVDWHDQRDKPAGRLKQRFAWDRKLYDGGKRRLIASVWRAPEALYQQPMRAWRDKSGTIPQDRWDALIADVVGYLVHARDAEGVQYELFSFNEPAYGVYVKLTADENIRLLSRLGAAMRQAGLRTKVLLGDTATCAQFDYAAQLARSEALMPHVGAIAYHTWDGLCDRSGEWVRLARKHRLPLLLTEVGVDASAWRDRSYTTLAYALRELELHLRLLAEAKPTAMLAWEWTGDYGNVAAEPQVAPTLRHWHQRHLANLTPPGARPIGAASDHHAVLAAAFAAGDDVVIHIANLGAERPITCANLPPGPWRIITTTPDASWQETPLPAGATTFTAPAFSLCTMVRSQP